MGCEPFVKKKILIALITVTAALIGFLAGYTVFETVPSDGFMITGERERGIVIAVSDMAEAGKICINTASAVELTDLPGVGPVLSERIVAYREEFGPFEDVEGLLGVNGIGMNVLERLRPYARCGE
jgi:competence ComEA-like helix-hairpin-helix protein